MAAFREHVSVSAMLGFGYGFAASLAFGYTFVQGVLAGCLTGVAGMLPDLDSSSGRPIREIFGLVGAVAPLLLVNRVIRWLDLSGDPETVMLVIVLLYLAIKYGGAALVGSLSVHRGMFHSIPALVIAAEVVYLSYPTSEMRVKLLMAGGVAIGFFSHLLLDEIYSVDTSNMQLKFKKSFGTAIKMAGEDFGPNVFTYTLMATLTYASLSSAGWLDQHTQPRAPLSEATGSDPTQTDAAQPASHSQPPPFTPPPALPQPPARAEIPLRNPAMSGGEIPGGFPSWSGVPAPGGLPTLPETPPFSGDPRSIPPQPRGMQSSGPSTGFGPR